MRGEEIAYLGCNADGLHGVHFVAVHQYPDGMPLVKEFPRLVESVLLRPKTTAGFLGGMFWLEAVLERSKGPAPELILPFVPGSRQDMLNPSGDYLFTAKSVARMVNALGLPRVTVVDPHSDVVAGLIDGCHVIKAADVVTSRVSSRDYDAVVAPDAGAEKRAGEVAAKLGLPLVHCWKRRDVATGELSGYGVERDCSGDRLLVVDDICDGGGTFLLLAKHIKARLLDLYVTHGLFTKGTQELCAHYKTVACSDSVVVDRPGVTVVPFCIQLLTKGQP